MKILAFSGSLRAASANSAIVWALGTLFPEHVSYELWEGLATLPHFSPELDFNASPEAVLNFRRLLGAADAVVICTPEYAFGMPGVLKNALDWLVSSGELDRKPVATISASPLTSGGEKAHAWLNQTLTALGARQLPDAKLIVPAVKGKLDDDGRIIDESLWTSLKQVATAVLRELESPVQDVFDA